MPDQLTAPTDVVLVDGCACRCHDGPGVPCSEFGGCGSIHARTRPPHTQEDAEGEAPAELTEDQLAELRQRRCARGRRCPDKERAKNPDGSHARHDGRKVWLGAQIAVDRGLCSTCDRAVRADLPKLTYDWVELNTLLAPGSGGAGEVVSSSRDLPVNLRLSVEALQKAIHDDTLFWAECLADEMRIDWDTQVIRDSRPAIRVQRAVRLVSAAVDTLLGLGPREQSVWDHGEYIDDPEFPGVQATAERDGIEGALRLLDLHERTTRTALRGELKHHLPAPCPRCSRLTLVRWNGESQVECEVCRDRWPETDYIRLTHVLSSEERLRIRYCKACDKDGRLPSRRMCTHPKQRVAA